MEFTRFYLSTKWTIAKLNLRKSLTTEIFEETFDYSDGKIFYHSNRMTKKQYCISSKRPTQILISKSTKIQGKYNTIIFIQNPWNRIW